LRRDLQSCRDEAPKPTGVSAARSGDAEAIDEHPREDEKPMAVQAIVARPALCVKA